MIWFIFLCLLFGKGLAQNDCLKPEKVNKALIENVKDRDKTSFPHNATLVYTCQPGRNISGDSAERTCVNGTWTEVKFKCKKLPSCPDLGVIKNGRIDYENPNRGIFSMAFYDCDANTDLFLNSTLAGYDEGARECQRDQQWSGPSDLHCKKRSTDNKAKKNCKLCGDIRCLKLVKATDIFKHGNEIYSRPVSEKFEMFRDEDGYLDTDVIKHKQTDGQWEKPFPKCIGARCSIKNNMNITISYTNGSATGLHVPSSSDVIVACKLNTSEHELKGFSRCKREPDGTAKCTCNKGVLKVPSCKPRKCLNKDLPDIAKSVATKSDPSQRINYLDVSKHTSKTFLRCYDKHELLESFTNTYKDATDLKVTCDFGKWKPNSDSLACVPRRCNVKALIQQNESQVWTMTGDGLYQSLKDNTVEHGQLIYMNCTVGFDLKSNDGRKLNMASDTCIKGTLNLPYKCQLKSCEKPVVKNGRILSLTDNQRNVKHNEQIRIKCDTKYEIFNNDGKVVNELIATCDKGIWNEREIICKQKRCLLNVNTISNYWYSQDGRIVSITKDTYIDHGMRVSTECRSNDGYILTDSHGLTSESRKRSYCFFGKWQYPYSCDFKKCPSPEFTEGTIKFKTGAVVNGDVTHSEKITFECNSPSRFDLSTMDDNTRVQSLDATCRLGNWSVPTPTCHPKRCLLKMNESSKSWYTNDERKTLITEDRFIDHGMNISKECNDGYILTNTQGNTLDTIDTARCNYGVWQNEFQCTAKPCEIPDVNNGRMLNLADSQQLVKHNEHLTIRCDAQYEIFNNAGQAGDELITTCDKGNWNEKEIVCKPKRCSLKVNDNSKYSYTNDNTIVPITEERFIDHGMNISNECKDGYILKSTKGNTLDTETSRCHFGVWQNKNKCIAKPCEIPVVNNGRTLYVTYNQQYVKHTEQITITCDPKYEMFNNDGKVVDELTTTCNKGTWTKKKIVCKPKRCILKVYNNSNYRYTHDDSIDLITKDRFMDHAMNISIDCKDGYILNNTQGQTSDTSETARCNFGVWQNEFQCTAKPCEIPDVNHGRMLNVADGQQLVKHNEQLTIKCDTKYEIFNNDGNAGDKLIAMCDKGNWNEKEIVCKPKRCSLKVNANSKYSYTKDNTIVPITKEKLIDHGMNISKECNDGYILTSSIGNTSDTIQTAQCNFGVWQNEFQCSAKPCEIPVVNNGRMLYLTDNQQYAKHTEQITIKCEPKHELFSNAGHADDELTTTCDKGNWTVNEIVCKPKRCILKMYNNSNYWYKHDASIDHITEERFIDHGMNISKECKDGYILTNTHGQTSDTSQTARCNFGVWQNEYNCTAKSCEILDVNNGRMLDLVDNQQYVKNNEQITIKCDAQYEIFNNNGQAVDELTTTCDKGNWNVKEIVCKPKRCLLEHLNNSNYWYTKHDSTVPITKEIFIEHGMNISIYCKDGYILTSTQGKTNETDQCNFGVWQNKYQCTAKSCKIPDVKNGSILSLTDNQQYVQDTKQLTIKCDAQYEIFSNAGKANDELNTTCDKGNWTEKQIVCKPKRCTLNVTNIASEFWIKTERTKRELITENTKIEHNVKVNIQCNSDGYYLASTLDRNQVGGTIETAVCNYGRWDNLYSCKRRECKLAFANGTVTVNKQEHSTGVLYEDETAKLECTSGLDMFDSSGEFFNNSFITTCRNKTLTKPLPFCKDRCYFSGSSNWQALRIKSNETIKEQFVQHGKKVQFRCNDGFDYTTDDVNTTTVYVCNDARWIPSLPVCESKTTSNESQVSSTTSHPTIYNLVTKRQDELSNVTKTTSAVSKVTFTGEGCVIDDQNRYIFYNTSGPERIILENGAVVGRGTKVYMQCLADDDYSSYYDYDAIDDNDIDGIDDIDEKWHVTCTGNTFTPIPDDLSCTQVVECEYKVAKGELTKALGGIGYYLNCNKGYTSNLQDSDTVSCKDGKLKSEYGLDPACNLDSDPCSIPNDMKNIEVTQEGSILTGGVTINHSETATFNCGKGKEPQGRTFKCVDGSLIAQDDDKDWTFANKGSFPQCRNTKCEENCNTHGTCVNDNVCECNVGYTGRLCDTDVACPAPFSLTNGTVLCEDASHLYDSVCDFICDSGYTLSGTQRKMTCQSNHTWSVSSSDVDCEVDCSNTCLANGGRCHTPNYCTCPETRYGNECLLSWCMGPQTNATVLNPKGKYNTNDKLRLTCPEGMQFSSEKDLECRSDGEWSHIVNCVPKQYAEFRIYSVVGSSKVDTVTLDIIEESGTVNDSEIEWSDNRIVTTHIDSFNIGKIKTVIMKVNYSSLYKWFLPKWLSIYLRNRNEYCGWKLDRWMQTTLTITNNGGCSTFEEKEAVSVIGRYPTKAFIVTDDIQCKLICAKERNCKGVFVTFGKYFNICHMYDSVYNKFNTTRADDNWNQFLYRKLSES